MGRRRRISFLELLKSLLSKEATKAKFGEKYELFFILYRCTRTVYGSSGK